MIALVAMAMFGFVAGVGFSLLLEKAPSKTASNSHELRSERILANELTCQDCYCKVKVVFDEHGCRQFQMVEKPKRKAKCAPEVAE